MAHLDLELVSLENRLTARPDDRALLAQLGAVHEQRNEYADALGIYARIVTADPGNLDAWARQGYCFMQLFMFRAALETFDFVLGIDPLHVDALYRKALCLETTGAHAQAVALMARAVALAPDNPTVYPFYAYLLATYGSGAEQALAAFRQWGERFADPLTHAAPRADFDSSPGRRLRIGYVSADLRAHSVAFFVEPVLAHHDRSRFEIHVFASGTADHVTARIRKTVDSWSDVTAMSDEKLAGLIRRRKIDILIDLSGHTMGNRLLAFARRPAPLSATWIGFPYTTGMAAMDYRITDFVLDPPGKTEDDYCETLFRLQRSACYQPPREVPLDLVAPLVHAGRPVFASLNNLKKVTDAMLGVWRRILDAVPDAILLLVATERDQAQAIGQNLARLTAAGLPPERLCILPRLSLDGFMQLGLKVDVALDTHPISGGTTTLHSLWMGLPVVTLAGGQAFAASSAALLEGIGHGDLIADDVDAYVKIAVSLARDPDRLTAFRSSIRDRMRYSMLMDYGNYTRDLEAAYRLMWLNLVGGDKRYLDTRADPQAAIVECETRLAQHRSRGRAPRTPPRVEDATTAEVA